MTNKNFINLDVRPFFGLSLSKKLEIPVIIYGAGNFGKDIYQCLIQSGIRVIAFLDRKATPESQWNGVPIYPPDWQDLSNSQKKIVKIIIAIHNRDIEIPPIISKLRLIGYRHFIQPVELYDTFSEQLGDRFWLTSRLSYKAWQAEIDECLSLWEDALSRKLFETLLNYRIQGNTEILPMPDLAHQYFPNDIPAWSSPIRFIDCGAYDGDTLRNAQNIGLKFDSVVLFEPDHVNFNRLTHFVVNEWDSPAFCWPCGVHSSTDQMRFALDGGEGGKLNEASGSNIQVVALDDVIYGFRPNLIKMDIEGAEIEALLGAKRLIIENEPGLAISVYHHPRHIWQIPLLVKTWNLDYRFYLRLHGHNGFDTVMYALPGEK